MGAMKRYLILIRQTVLAGLRLAQEKHIFLRRVARIITISSHPGIKLLMAAVAAIVVGSVLDPWGWGIAIFLIAMFPFIWIACEYIYEYDQKGKILKEAKMKAMELGKPLLNAGCGQLYWHAINEADVNLDNEARDVSRFVLASIEDIPYPDKYFGAAFCSHTLEHASDWRRGLSELHRVADNVYFIVPKPIWIGNWLNPNHKRVFANGKVWEFPSGRWEKTELIPSVIK